MKIPGLMLKSKSALRTTGIVTPDGCPKGSEGQESGGKVAPSLACRRYARYGYGIGVESTGRFAFKERS